jgi:hypothetical protein
MAAGEQARIGAEALQQFERVLDAGRSLVLKRRWNLQVLPISLSFF